MSHPVQPFLVTEPEYRRLLTHPFHAAFALSTFPFESTATQKAELAQETEVSDAPGSTETGAVQ